MSAFLINDTISFAVVTHDPATSGISDADADPTFVVIEEVTEAEILSGNMSKRGANVGEYLGSFLASAGNGFEVGKYYNLIVTATVGGITAKVIALESLSGRDISSFHDWTSAERDQMRYRLGVDGNVAEPQVVEPDFLRDADYLGKDFTQQEHDDIVARIDATISSRLAASSYVAPDNATIGTMFTQFNSMTQADGEGGFQYTVKSLELGPGSGISTGQARGVAAGPTQIDIDQDVPQVFYYYLYCYDADGLSVTPDALPTIAAANQLGEDRNANLGVVTELSVGTYRVSYTVPAAAPQEQLEIVWSHLQSTVEINTPFHVYQLDYIGVTNANIIAVDGNPVTSADDFKADTSNLALENSVQAVKTKTDNLPDDPASTADVNAARDNIKGYGDMNWITADISDVALESTAQAIKQQTDKIPTDPATTTNIEAAKDEILDRGNIAWVTADISGLAQEVTLLSVKTVIDGVSEFQDDTYWRFTALALEETPDQTIDPSPIEEIILDMTEDTGTYWRYKRTALELGPTGEGGDSGGGIELPPSPFLEGCNKVVFVRGDTWGADFVLPYDLTGVENIWFGIKSEVDAEDYDVLISLVDGLIYVNGEAPVTGSTGGKILIQDAILGEVRVVLSEIESSKLYLSSDSRMEFQVKLNGVVATPIQAIAEIAGDVVIEIA